MNCQKRIFTLIILITIIAWGGMGVSLAADNRGHGAPADALPKELKNVSVKDYFLPGKTKEAGIIQTAMGHVVVAHGDLRQAYFAANGDKLYEQDIVFTLKASKCRVKLINNDIITMGDRTRITIKEVAGETNKAEKKTKLSMAQGKAMFYAIRVLSQKGAAMTVESPTTVAGVRGTKFGMEVAIEGEENTTASLPLLLAEASDDWGRHLILAQANPPTPTITTTVHGFDGTVTVTSTVDGRTQSVGAGQTVLATPQGVGAAMPTPPQVAQRFQAATDVPSPGSGAGSSNSSKASGKTPDAKASSDSTGTSTTNTPDISSITQQQNINKEEKKGADKKNDPVTDPKTNASGANRKVGYFTSLLSNITDGTLAGVFASQNRYDGDSNVWARGLSVPGTDYVRAQGNSGVGAGATLKWVVFQSGTQNSQELNASFLGYEIGRNANMNWGYATVPNSFTVDNKSYAFDNRSYYIFGQNLPSIINLSGAVSYSGDVWGTYWSSSGGGNMTGSFTCDVNLTTAKLNNFHLDARDGWDRYATIDGASGSIGSDAHFTLTGGTWSLNGVTPDKTSGAGSLYGSNAENMGGVWAMYSTANGTGAAGIFGGNKSVPSSGQSGHYVGMLDKGNYEYVDTYMNTSVQDFKSSNAQAVNTDETYSTKIDGTGATKNMVELGVSNVGTWSGSKAVSFTKSGSNEYMEWGTWKQTSEMPIIETNYYYNNMGAYVWGSYTTDSEMTTLKSNRITGIYEGNAWGTMFVGNGAGTSLTGTFRSRVNFESPILHELDIKVYGSDGKSVEITNALGEFTGTTSAFKLNTNIGSWKINTNTADSTKSGASGNIYGSGADKGKYIGGVWKISDGTNNAVGGFQGSK